MARFALYSVSAVTLLAYSLTATTHYVGTCRTGSFQTITAAINDPNTVTGDTIAVCPGIYPEQVIISKAVTLHGIASGNSSYVQIAPGQTPTTILSSVLATVLAPNIWVTATEGPVTINNVTSPAGCSLPSGQTGVAFYYASGTSGTLEHVRAKGCGVGVWVENASDNFDSVTIENSVIGGANFCGSSVCPMKYGIVAASQQPPNTIPVLNAAISGNQIQDSVYGVYLVGAIATVSANSVSYSGIICCVQGYGIYVLAPGATISNNTLIAAPEASVFTGVFIKAANTSVTNNKITARQGIDFNCLAANVTGNTINAINGLLNVPSFFSSTNSFFNTRTIRSNVC